MTYLDPNHARTHFDWSKWLVRGIAVLAIAGIGYVAATAGIDSNGRPEIVQEPISRSF